MPGPDDKDYNIDDLMGKLFGGEPQERSGSGRVRSIRADIERFLDTKVTDPHTLDEIPLRTFLDQVLPEQLATMGEHRLRDRVGDLYQALVNYEMAEDSHRVAPFDQQVLSQELKDVQKADGILADVKGYFDDVLKTDSSPGNDFERQEQETVTRLFRNFSDTLEVAMRHTARLARIIPNELQK